MIKGAIFDVDGTLIDSMEMWNECGARYLARLGIEARPGLAEQMAILPIHESGEYIRRHYPISLTAEEITDGLNRLAYDFYMNEAELKPHIPELLGALREAGIPMTVATASDAALVDKVLTRLKIRSFFDTVHDCRELGTDKKHPECFLRCAGLLGTPPSETWMFEDMLHAASTAHAAGLKVAGLFDRSSAANEEKMREICDVYLKEEADFRAFLDRIASA